MKGFIQREQAFPHPLSIALTCVLIGLLAACSPLSTDAPTLTPTEIRTGADLGPTLTPTIAPPTATPAPPTPTLAAIPAISDIDWSRGPIDAPITFLIYSDFQCPYCARLNPVLDELFAMHLEDIRIIFRHFPLIIMHDKAFLAGQAAEAAGQQGRFWEMHDLLYERQHEWVDISAEDFIEWLKLIVAELELDLEQFISVLQDEDFAEAMIDNYENGLSYGFSGTPMIFINGEYFQFEPSLTRLEGYIRLALLEPYRQSNYPPHTLSEGKTYLAHLELNIGEMIIQLYPDSAPIAVNSFVYLANQGWYDNNPIYSVNPGRLVKSGDPTGTGDGDQGYHFALETDPALAFDQPGLVALSSKGPNTLGSRFFITLAPLPEFNDTRTIFGRVITGLELLFQLEARDPSEDFLSPPQAIIKKITIEEK